MKECDILSQCCHSSTPVLPNNHYDLYLVFLTRGRYIIVFFVFIFSWDCHLTEGDNIGEFDLGLPRARYNSWQIHISIKLKCPISLNHVSFELFCFILKEINNYKVKLLYLCLVPINSIIGMEKFTWSIGTRPDLWRK